MPIPDVPTPPMTETPGFPGGPNVQYWPEGTFISARAQG